MKKIKVFWNGKRLRDMYPHSTWFQVLKWKMYRILRKVLIASFVLGLITGAYKLGVATNTATYAAEVIVKDTLKDKVEALKVDLVRRLSDQCEFRDKNALPGVIDSNGNGGQQVVYGDFQFLPTTVKQYVKSLRGQDITFDEAIILALNEEEAAELAKDIIFKVEGGIYNWTNCAKKLGLIEDVKYIKNLEK